MSLQALRIGAAATWWAGLIIGAAMLIANNPSRSGPQLPYARLVARLPIVLAITAITAAIFGFAGYEYFLNGISADFQNLAETNLWRPHRFMTVYGIHLGGYVGGGHWPRFMPPPAFTISAAPRDDFVAKIVPCPKPTDSPPPSLESTPPTPRTPRSSPALGPSFCIPAA